MYLVVFNAKSAFPELRIKCAEDIYTFLQSTFTCISIMYSQCWFLSILIAEIIIIIIKKLLSKRKKRRKTEKKRKKSKSLWYKEIYFSYYKLILHDQANHFIFKSTDLTTHTLTFSKWSCRESISRSPTGCQDPLNASAWRSFRSSSSIASWRPCSLSRASSIFFCQSAERRFSLSHSVLTSSACLRRTLVTFWALSSGDRSK